MNSALKWIIIIVVAVILLLLILPFLIPVNSFRPTIEQKASQALGRQVQLGNLSLSILGGSLGVDNLSISDDPKFSSNPFITAKEVKVGVELMPLIFSKQVNVTEITVVHPQVVLLKDPSGKWNFSSIGQSANSTPASSQSSSSGQAVSVAKLSVTMKIDGKVGPEDTKDAAQTPQDVKLTINGLNLASTGFLDPSLGLAGLVDMDSALVSKDGKMSTKGSLTLSKAVLVQGGKPATVPAVINFDTIYNLSESSGVLNPSTITIGNAKSNLSGTYKSVGDEFVVDMKVNGQNLPATDLQSFLPALAINIPQGSQLSAGTMSADLHITGPTDKLVTDGTLGLFNGKLSNFDLGQKMSGVASLAGIKTGKDLDIQKFTTNLHMAPTGLKADQIDLVVPSLGTVVGGGTVDSKNEMNFNLVASVTAGIMGSASGGLSSIIGGGGSACKDGGMKVPLQVKGTTANPQFVPDVGGATASMLKSQLTCSGGALGGLAGKSGGTAGSVGNALGGLLGGKPKP
jgi:AsmA protein